MVFGRRFIVGDIFKKKLFFLTVRATFDDLRNWFFADLSVTRFGRGVQLSKNIVFNMITLMVI